MLSSNFCAHCDTTFKTERALAKHVRTSPNHPKCWRCDHKLLQPSTCPSPADCKQFTLTNDLENDEAASDLPRPMLLSDARALWSECCGKGRGMYGEKTQHLLRMKDKRMMNKNLLRVWDMEYA
ncbi:hypothetical protein CYLTODRAFT_492152 [Cylindrobasidium torrendii FP15055 ss-10]|uniref:Uncharacterized protein n=1 Tax=Cylindrobasidium torrendii FP15055 ss-10 TaxID=1314674 RepID=A0A0D7B4Z6_9AGAR|nr:hypothetical protein CYLTODRAFT_492152 [Cylindrobasidium torrendii FP15055 ss-10]